MNNFDYFLQDLVDKLEEQQVKLCDIVWEMDPDHVYKDRLLDAIISLEGTLTAIEEAMIDGKEA